jgi:hypothetical protein
MVYGIEGALMYTRTILVFFIQAYLKHIEFRFLRHCTSRTGKEYGMPFQTDQSVKLEIASLVLPVTGRVLVKL